MFVTISFINSTDYDWGDYKVTWTNNFFAYKNEKGTSYKSQLVGREELLDDGFITQPEHEVKERQVSNISVRFSVCCQI